jgi:hypothetical protein
VKNPRTKESAELQFGSSSSFPVPADYDGDGQAEFAYFEALPEPHFALFAPHYSKRALQVFPPLTGAVRLIKWGKKNEVPVEKLRLIKNSEAIARGASRNRQQQPRELNRSN